MVDVLLNIFKYFFVCPQEFSALWNCHYVCKYVLIVVILFWLLLFVLWWYVVIIYNWIFSTCLIMDPFKTMIKRWFSCPVKDSAVVLGYPERNVKNYFSLWNIMFSVYIPVTCFLNIRCGYFFWWLKSMVSFVCRTIMKKNF